ncbi:hypothetical protein BPS26883_01587 [Burkholderia pseudomultivorans]|uniref:Uncharacterized protein n=1 Tax=Burkholderia pseudomultivorans TaxID=1207504 RepID=A0A6P2J379_9BURK|nr:hypothetical protein BPS26883_01587 [Burkholderia pseudomultivorans]
MRFTVNEMPLPPTMTPDRFETTPVAVTVSASVVPIRPSVFSTSVASIRAACAPIDPAELSRCAARTVNASPDASLPPALFSDCATSSDVSPATEPIWPCALETVCAASVRPWPPAIFPSRFDTLPVAVSDSAPVEVPISPATFVTSLAAIRAVRAITCPCVLSSAPAVLSDSASADNVPDRFETACAVTFARPRALMTPASLTSCAAFSVRSRPLTVPPTFDNVPSAVTSTAPAALTVPPSSVTSFASRLTLSPAASVPRLVTCAARAVTEPPSTSWPAESTPAYACPPLSTDSAAVRLVLPPDTIVPVFDSASNAFRSMACALTIVPCCTTSAPSIRMFAADCRRAAGAIVTSPLFDTRISPVSEVIDPASRTPTPASVPIIRTLLANMLPSACTSIATPGAAPAPSRACAALSA